MILYEYTLFCLSYHLASSLVLPNEATVFCWNFLTLATRK